MLHAVWMAFLEFACFTYPVWHFVWVVFLDLLCFGVFFIPGGVIYALFSLWLRRHEQRDLLVGGRRV